MTRLCQKLRTRKTCVKNLQQHMKCMQYGSSSPPPWGCPPCPALLYGHRIPALFCSQEWGPLLSTCSFPPTPWQIPLSKALGWRLIEGVCSKAWDASKVHPPPPNECILWKWCLLTVVLPLLPPKQARCWELPWHFTAFWGTLGPFWHGVLLR